MPKQKFYEGKIYTDLPRELFCKYGAKVSPSMTMYEAVEKLGMTEEEIRKTYSTYKIDTMTFVQM